MTDIFVCSSCRGVDGVHSIFLSHRYIDAFTSISCSLYLPGELRVELFNQTVLELGTYDDGPYEVAGENSQKPELIPLPSHSYLGMGSWLAAGERVREKEADQK